MKRQAEPFLDVDQLELGEVLDRAAKPRPLERRRDSYHSGVGEREGRLLARRGRLRQANDASALRSPRRVS
eukprot:6017949-Heterocapsa_arctica.AAC.1